jgi:hypothetical protein
MTAGLSWWNGRTRLLVFVFGGLLVLQRSDTLDLPKLVYLIAAVAIVVSSAVVTWQMRAIDDLSETGPWIAISIAFALVLAVSLPVALAHGIGFTPWLRAIAAYGLFAAAPLVAIDARRTVSAREAVGWTTLAGTLAAISFALYWVDYRQIAELPIAPLVLPSAQLAYAGFAVMVAFAFRSKRAVPWAIGAGLILGLLLISGTRTSFLLLAVPVILAIVAGREQWRQVGTATLVGIATTAAVVVLTIAALSNPITPPGPIIGAATTPPGSTSPDTTSNASPAPVTSGETARPELIGERLGSVGSVLSDPASGQSLKERIAQTQVAFSVFAADPLLGAGPGRVYAWTNVSGVPIESRSLDTPLMVAAEFGLLGILVCLALVGVFAWFIRLTARRIPGSPEYLCVVGLATTFGLTSLLGPPMDDKGAAYALALVLTIALSALASRSGHAEA